MRGRPPIYKYLVGNAIRVGALYKYAYRGQNYLLKSKINGTPDYFNLDFFELQNPQTLVYQNEGTALTANPLIFGRGKVKYREGGEITNTTDSAVPFHLASASQYVGDKDFFTGRVFGNNTYKMRVYAPATFPGYSVESVYSPAYNLNIGRIAIGETVTVNIEKANTITNSDFELTIYFLSNTVNIITTPLSSDSLSCRYSLPSTLGATKVLTLFNNAGTIDITYA